MENGCLFCSAAHLPFIEVSQRTTTTIRTAKTTVNISPTKNKPRKGWNMAYDIGKEEAC